MFDEGKNLSQEMHVLRAVRWGIQAWEWDVDSSTIQACWRRSQAINYGAFPAVPRSPWTECETEVNSLYQDLYRLKQRGVIQSIPAVHDYISPYSGPWNERIDDHGELEDLVDDIVATRIQQEVDEEEEDGQLIKEPLPLITSHEALEALHILRRYEEAYQWSDEAFLRSLRRFERELGERYQESKEQATLDRYFIIQRESRESRESISSSQRDRDELYTALPLCD
jgi:predicted transcriptional regulator